MCCRLASFSPRRPMRTPRSEPLTLSLEVSVPMRDLDGRLHTHQAQHLVSTRLRLSMSLRSASVSSSSGLAGMNGAGSRGGAVSRVGAGVARRAVGPSAAAWPSVATVRRPATLAGRPSRHVARLRSARSRLCRAARRPSCSWPVGLHAAAGAVACRRPRPRPRHRGWSGPSWPLPPPRTWARPGCGPPRRRRPGCRGCPGRGSRCRGRRGPRELLHRGADRLFDVLAVNSRNVIVFVLVVSWTRSAAAGDCWPGALRGPSVLERWVPLIGLVLGARLSSAFGRSGAAR